ncbi:Spy/CpxP family protein refolding chaperone [Jeongeupia sp. USM3]|uniref:Spy/CpxP family protein refolding chaperone n=1 Tax=Jeongeupia sp. USM3 TaxID=1906741 RepID=UPI00089DE7BA|nr:Spy/CpxP family protein refolding chaperone [Jeongeupia sp. USM3]AOY01731.1 hypothetical protein BJP62_15455 [Jeongeupia sp. USM3]
MKRNRPITASLVSGLVAVLLLGTAATAMAAPDASAPDAARGWGHHQRMSPEQWQQMSDARLGRMAERLKITPAQQGAWDTYARSVRATFTPPPARQNGVAAAEQLRQRAAMMQEHARRMLQLADATETLSRSLTPEQNKTLDMMTGRFGPGMNHKGMHGPRGACPAAQADAAK